jgi:hypothetical protein
MENKSKPRKMKELIRIEDFNPEHVNGLLINLNVKLLNQERLLF